jgi:hypothetical protein
VKTQQEVDQVSHHEKKGAAGDGMAAKKPSTSKSTGAAKSATAAKKTSKGK